MVVIIFDFGDFEAKRFFEKNFNKTSFSSKVGAGAVQKKVARNN